MLKYSLMSKYSNCTRDEIVEFLSNTNKTLKFTYGFEYRHPTTYRVPISKEDAIAKVKRGMCDVDEYEDWVLINEFSSNDMW